MGNRFWDTYFETRLKLKGYWREKIPMAIAWRLPKRIAFWCFVRVHALCGDAPESNGEYKKAYYQAVDKWGISP